VAGSGGRADGQLLGNALVAPAAGDQRGDLPLPWCQRSGPGPGARVLGRVLGRGPAGSIAAGNRPRGAPVQGQLDRRVAARGQPLRPQPLDGGLPQAARRPEGTLHARAGQRGKARRLAQRTGRGGQPDGLLRPVFAGGQGRERLEPARDPDPGAGGPAEPDALGQVLPRKPELIQLDGDPRQAGQAPRDLRPGANFPQDGKASE